MRFLSALSLMLVLGCKTTDPLSDDISRPEITEQGGQGRCVEDAERGNAPVLGDSPNSDTFGIGSGVSVKCHDKVSFRIDAPAHPSRATLKLNVSNLSADEVTVFLNGREIGSLAGDGARSVDLPLDVLRQGQNALVIDNVKNPPGDESWAVSELAVEFD